MVKRVHILFFECLPCDVPEGKGKTPPKPGDKGQSQVTNSHLQPNDHEGSNSTNRIDELLPVMIPLLQGINRAQSRARVLGVGGEAAYHESN